MREKKRVKGRKELPGALYPQGRFSSGKQKTGKGRRMGEGGLDGLNLWSLTSAVTKEEEAKEGITPILYDLWVAIDSAHW